MEDLSATVQVQIATTSQPVRLCTLSLDVGDINFAGISTNVIFPTGGDTYSAITFEGDTKKESSENQIVYKDYKFDNRNGYLQGLNAVEPFKNKNFVEKKIYYGFSGVSDYREVMSGIMEEPEFDEQGWMNIRVIRGKKLDYKVINDYYQKLCNNEFGDENCNYDGNADLTSLTATGNADSGATNYLIDSALTQADDYWNYGEIEMNVSGTVYERKVTDFTAATDKITFDVPLPISVIAGSTYTVYKGCPKTLSACRSESAFGPNADNEDNFIGFIHLVLTKGVDK